jgi:hypothetical protein
MTHGSAHRKHYEKLPLFEQLYVTNPSVSVADTERLSEQAKEVYRRLLEGPAMNHELSDIAMQYNARIYEIRKMLETYGKTVKMKRFGGGTNQYFIERTDDGAPE